MAHKLWTRTHEDGSEEEVQLPAKWEICTTCEGEGKSSAYLGVIQPEDWDPEELEDYMRGVYDRRCEDCKGEGKTLEVDLDRMPTELRTAYEAYLEEEYQYRRICEAERRMGA